MSYQESQLVSSKRFEMLVENLTLAIRQILDQYKATMLKEVGQYANDILNADVPEIYPQPSRRSQKRFWGDLSDVQKREAIDRMKKGHSVLKMADDLKVSYSSLLTHLKKLPNYKRLVYSKFTDKDKELAKRLYEKGFHISRISSHMQMSPYTVRKHLKAMGVHKPKGRGAKDGED